MANRYVRLYRGPEDQSTIVGFSRSAVPDREEDLIGFFSDRGHEVRRYRLTGDLDPHDLAVINTLGGTSMLYYDVKPPLASPEAVKDFGDWCKEYVDPYHNQAYLIDNRDTPPPLQPFDLRDVIASW